VALLKAARINFGTLRQGRKWIFAAKIIAHNHVTSSQSVCWSHLSLPVTKSLTSTFNKGAYATQHLRVILMTSDDRHGLRTLSYPMGLVDLSEC
jgi:hypothetical protein